jgi:hypothetical protein
MDVPGTVNDGDQDRSRLLADPAIVELTQRIRRHLSDPHLE